MSCSNDEGKTWRQVMVPNSAGRVHPTVVELEDGHLVNFMRSREADWIYRSESFDYGDTWTEPVPTVLPNNNSGICAIKLKSGRIAVTRASSATRTSPTTCSTSIPASCRPLTA